MSRGHRKINVTKKSVKHQNGSQLGCGMEVAALIIAVVAVVLMACGL